jgi:4a-hydroxytetrahydrobiopterin dehydratase
MAAFVAAHCPGKARHSPGFGGSYLATAWLRIYDPNLLRMEIKLMNLVEKKCIPCSGGVPALTRKEFAPLLQELDDWTVENDKKLVRSFQFDNFAKPMELAKKIADIAEHEQHHPDLLVRWGELKVELWTHKIDGLTESDFILAAKIDRCASPDEACRASAV